MRVALAWDGGVACALALARLRAEGHETHLVHVTDARTRRDDAGVPDFLVEEQAACLGVPVALASATLPEAVRALRPDAFALAGPGGEKVADLAVPTLRPLEGLSAADALREAAARGVRAFLVACRPPLGPAHLGRFLEPPFLETLDALRADPGGLRTFAVDGPGFARRVDATAGDAQTWGDGWRLDLGLRGC